MNPEDQSFAASATHPDFGDEPVAGQIVVGQWELRFNSEKGGVEIPFNELKIFFERGRDEPVLFRCSTDPGWTIHPLDNDILGHRVFSQNHHLRLQLQKFAGRKALRRALAVTAGFLAAFVLVSICVSWLSTQAVTILVRRIPAKWEKELGDSAFDSIKEERKVVDDPQQLAELKLIGAQLVRGLPDPSLALDFHVIEDPTANAFAIPGGHVFVNTGFFDLTTNRDEIAGTLAHELAHVTQRHVFRKIISAAGPYFITKLLLQDRGGVLQAVSRQSRMLIGQTFSKEYENEADAIGWQYLVNANIDPRGLASALEKMQARQDEMLAMFKHAGFRTSGDHPPTEERIQRLNA
ncbi:MAG TPA: M48 family metallopeptidase, partial [Verrucomicrobiae bacterium]|nr:M48 family metallopeptidase [Verrucomicrobiae bacterium]